MDFFINLTAQLRSGDWLSRPRVRAYATKLGEEDAATLLSQTLEEEKEADETLNGIAEELDLEVPQESVRSEQRTVKSSRGRTRSAA